MHNLECDKCIELTYRQLLSFLAKSWRLTNVKTSYQNWSCAVTADSTSRWPHGRKAQLPRCRWPRVLMARRARCVWKVCSGSLRIRVSFRLPHCCLLTKWTISINQAPPPPPPHTHTHTLPPPPRGIWLCTTEAARLKTAQKLLKCNCLLIPCHAQQWCDHLAWPFRRP